ncbi:ABC transporter permease [Pelagibacterium montanilacus]|uniref:ABC transporter permease n=1 Tax=Pelagibacterium montanilacus TaxID=2185280 RepID=UPI000F8C8764|nr:ABC transporter permease [Pelagibacterium montanilacus]
MLAFIVRRLLAAIPFMFLVSITVFILIQLPPGDFATSYAASLSAAGEYVDQNTIAELRARYGLNDPLIVQYFRWIGGILMGDFGYSFQWNSPVSELIGERMGLTVLLTFATVIFTWAVALPLGIYAAVHKYSIGDYIFTFIGFIGLAIPNFLLALVMMYFAVVWFGQDVSGLFSPEFRNAPWSWARMVDLGKHLIIPILVLGTASTAGMMRVMRANLLDQLHQPYVVTARAKGLSEARLLTRYPIRIALNPFVSTIGWLLPTLVSGEIITSIILSLPTAGPLLLQALLAQDYYLSGAFLLLLCMMTVVGTLISDILLVLLDPRIRYS